MRSVGCTITFIWWLRRHGATWSPGWNGCWGEYRIGKDNAAGRRQLEEELERRRREEDGQAFKAVRRGWCLGGTEFRRELLEQMAGAMGEHHDGEELWETAEAVAESIVAKELARLGWSDDDFPNRSKGDPGKVATARRLRQETTTTLKWIAQRLAMGSASMVSHCLRFRWGRMTIYRTDPFQKCGKAPFRGPKLDPRRL